jgi:hypothetical protein
MGDKYIRTSISFEHLIDGTFTLLLTIFFTSSIVCKFTTAYG